MPQIYDARLQPTVWNKSCKDNGELLDKVWGKKLLVYMNPVDKDGLENKGAIHKITQSCAYVGLRKTSLQLFFALIVWDRILTMDMLKNWKAKKESQGDFHNE